MNCFSVALQRAVALAQSREELEAEFNAALHELQFADDGECVVVGVPFESALNWANGLITDLDLVLSMSKEIGAVWWPIIPNRRSYATGVREARRLVGQGARILIGHTHNEIVRNKCLKHGGRVTHRGATGGTRILCDTPAVNHWLKL